MNIQELDKITFCYECDSSSVAIYCADCDFESPCTICGCASCWQL